MKEISTIVIGALNTDIIARGVSHFPKPGQHVNGKELVIGPGGKARNIAAMIAQLTSRDSVAMIGRTVRDDYGLWKLPVEALDKVGVNTKFIKILDRHESDKLPSIVLIPVDNKGNNLFFALPGISDDFSKSDIDAADELFDTVSQNKGMLVISLECPLETAQHAVRKANNKGIRVALDPGGITNDMKIDDLIKEGLYLIKPNEHETKIITGIGVVDLGTAVKAAERFKKLGVQNILITVGDKGAYLFTESVKMHIPIPKIKIDTATQDATGCGDQAMATLLTFLNEGKTFEEAAELALVAGTLEFHKFGIQPITRQEIESQISAS